MSYGPPNDPNQPQGAPPPAQPQYQQPPPQYQQPPQYQPPAQPGGQAPLHVPAANQIAAGFQRFSLGRKLLLGAGAVAIIAYFLPWYSAEGLSAGSGVAYALPLLGFLLLLATLVAFALPLFGKRLSDIVKLPYPEGMVALAGSGATLALGLLGGLISKPADQSAFGFSVDYSYSLGFFLAVLALGAMTAGGWLMFQAKE